LLGWQRYQAPLAGLHAYLSDGRPAAVTLFVQIASEGAGFVLEVNQIRFDDGSQRPLPSTSLARRRLQCPSHPDACTVEPFLLTLFWYDALVQEISDAFFALAGMPVNGLVFSLQLRDEAVQASPTESLSSFFARELQVQIPMPYGNRLSRRSERNWAIRLQPCVTKRHPIAVFPEACNWPIETSISAWTKWECPCRSICAFSIAPGCCARDRGVPLGSVFPVFFRERKHFSS
jgi:hypothetical protein